MSLNKISGSKFVAFGANNNSANTKAYKPNQVGQSSQSKDSFTSSKSNQDSMLAKAAKYAGLAALAAVPITAIVLTKNFNKATQNLSNQISNLSNRLSGVANEASQAVTDQLTKNPDTLNKTVTTALTSALGGVAALEGIKSLFKDGKINLPEQAVVTAQPAKPQKPVKHLPESVEEVISSQIASRIEGKNPWPQIENPKAWMVTAEVEGIVKTGGLAEVARQLPDAFNDKYKDNPDKQIDIVAPLYVQDGKQILEPIAGEENKFNYISGKTKIELTKVATIPVQVYDEKHDKYVDENTEVFTGKMGNTNYVFLRNDKYFDIKGTPYEVNKSKIGETERMAYFSKAAYETMIAAKEGKVNVQAPNVILANDWHASTMSALMRYRAPIDAADDKLSKDTLDYINNTPLIYIVHNNMYQGASYEVGNKVFKTLFGDYDASWADEVKIDGKDGEFRFADGIGSINSSSFAINLADAVVPVSPNYAQELAKSSDFGAQFQEIYKERNKNGTLQGITNGYDKVKTEPNEKTAEVANALNPPRKFKPFAGMYNDEGYAIKQENKEILFDYVKDIIPKYVDYSQSKDANKQQPIKGVELYQPEKCDLSKVDIDKTPFIVSVGRLTEQKGIDYMCLTLQKIYAQCKKDKTVMPVTMILGSDNDSNQSSAAAIKDLKSKLAEVSPEAANRVLFFEGFSAPLATALRYGGDFMPIPSKWEPCGLTQIEAMGVGALPVALPTGGLPITINDGKDGFLASRFYGYNNGEVVYSKDDDLVPQSNNVDAFTQVMRKALDTYYTDREKIKQMSIEAMKRDFSWNQPDGALEKYEHLMSTGKVA